MFNSLRMWDSCCACILYSVWGRGVNTIVDCWCDQSGQVRISVAGTNSHWHKQHQEYSIKSSPRSEDSIELVVLMLDSILEITSVENYVFLYLIKTFLFIMGVDAPNVPGLARPAMLFMIILNWARLRPGSGWGWPEINYQFAVSGERWSCLWEAGPCLASGLEWWRARSRSQASASAQRTWEQRAEKRRGVGRIVGEIINSICPCVPFSFHSFHVVRNKHFRVTKSLK